MHTNAVDRMAEPRFPANPVPPAARRSRRSRMKRSQRKIVCVPSAMWNVSANSSIKASRAGWQGNSGNGMSANGPKDSAKQRKPETGRVSRSMCRCQPMSGLGTGTSGHRSTPTSHSPLHLLPNQGSRSTFTRFPVRAGVKITQTSSAGGATLMISSSDVAPWATFRAPEMRRGRIPSR